ncbi:activating transcription factor 7-interacting protein 2 [Lathamus discolor]|uniref:activating transcription factor 7-interacting protein 2 n=1 Tax=Lathamus discolor TaxID=678569 RepID=UPI0032B704F9
MKRSTERKRLSSVTEENTPCKCMKIADEIKQKPICTVSKNEKSLLGKINLVIAERIDILNNFFYQKLESLNKRAEEIQCKEIQCKETHEETAISFLKKLSKLERRIEAAKAFQEEVFSKMAVHQAEQIGAYKYLSNYQNSKPVCINQGLLKLREETSNETSKQFTHPAPLPRIPLCPEVIEEFQDPPRNLETRSGLFAKPNSYSAYRN